jgi:hypothetical protein
MEPTEMKTKEWFIERIGKRIFRNDNFCGAKCKTCKIITENGLVIADETHASYLFEVQNDYRSEGIILDYRDEK